MSDLTFEIRICESCGLRYPLQKGHGFGERCPHCLGETQSAISKTVKDEERKNEQPIKRNGEVRAVLLDNIRSAWNVGSILRSADGFGFDRVYLCGITTTPDNEAVGKTSLGAEKNIAWSHHKDALKIAQELKNDGWRIVALEEGEDAKMLDLDPIRLQGKWVLILGSEVTGVDPDLLDLCDEVYAIPMRGVKRSLNVAIAFSIAAFALCTSRS